MNYFQVKITKKVNPDNSKTIYVLGIYEVDKTSGGTVTQTRTYYPAAGAMRIGSTLYYVLKDHLGSASVITNASGVTVSGGEQRYYPYGESRLTATMLTDKLFTGQREMIGLGIYHYQSRFYSPKIGRFLSADTIVPSHTNPQSLNRFSYTLNNPLRYTDPTGHYASCYGQHLDDGPQCTQGGWINNSSDIVYQNEKYQDECAKGKHRCDELPEFAITGIVAAGMAEYALLSGAAADAPAAAQAAYDQALFACLKSYACAKILAKVTGITLYRVWGRDPNQPPEGFSGPWGPSWTPINPSTVSNFRSIAGLPNENLGRFISIGKIYDIEGIIIKSADEILANPGGLLEYKFTESALPALRIILQNVLGINPPY